MLAGLPDSVPPAPWEGTAGAVMWLTRGGKAATHALPPMHRGRVAAIGVVAGMVHYRDSPVGSYREVFGNVSFLRRVRARCVVSFIAVDLPASLVAGRRNWSLPKTLARFDGEPGGGRTMTAIGHDWNVSATVTALGPAVPIRSSMALEQEWPDGHVRTSRVRFRGRGKLALVTVELEAPGSLSKWLKSGRHPGLAFETLQFTLDAPARS